MLRLTRVHIRRYRSVAPNTVLEFGPGHVFLLGKNGSGKTTLLELLAKLASCELSSFKDETQPVDLEWEVETEWQDAGEAEGKPNYARLRLCLELGLPTKQMDLSVGREAAVASSALPDPSHKWRFSGVVYLEPATTSQRSLLDAEDAVASAPEPVLRFSYSRGAVPQFEPAVEQADGRSDTSLTSPFDRQPLGRVLVDLLNLLSPAQALQQQDAWSKRISHLGAFAVETSTPVQRFDEALGAYSFVVDAAGPQAQAAMISQVPPTFTAHLVPAALGFALFRSGWTELRATGTMNDASNAATELNPPRLLTKILSTLEAEEVELRPRLLEEDPEGRRTYRGFDIFVRWPGGSKHRHDQLSFGQKRIIAFLWYAAVFEQLPLITDELTNGLHASWVRKILDLLQDRQAFHAIQNPLMLDMVGPGEVDEIPRRFVLCDMGPGEKGTVWRWRNPTLEEADRLRRAWEAGFQQLSEVLQSEGLW